MNKDTSYGKIIKYKEFICVVGDYNYDNSNESIVEIYKSRRDFRNGEYLENISLNNKNLKQNIKDYIDENYI